MRRRTMELPGRLAFAVSRNSPGLSRSFAAFSFIVLLCAFALAGFGTMEETVKAPCILRSRSAPSEVRNSVSGRILRFPCRDGEKVSAGQVLFEIDSGNLRIELEGGRERRNGLQGRLGALLEYSRAIASGAAIPGIVGNEFASRLEALSSTLETASLRVERIEDEIEREESMPESSRRPKTIEALYSERREVFASLEGALAKERAAVEAELFQMGEEVKASLAREKDLEKRISDCLVRAPISGIVEIERRSNAADYLFAGDAVLKINPAEEGEIEVEISVPNGDIARVGSGMEVRYVFPAAPLSGRRKMRGEVLRVGKDVRGGTGGPGSMSFAVHASLDIPPSGEERFPPGWRPMIGMAAEARIISGKKTILEWILEKMDFAFE